MFIDSKLETISNLFEDKEITSIWDNEKEGSKVTTLCSQLKMLAPGGKMRLRDALDTKGFLRLIEFAVI